MPAGNVMIGGRLNFPDATLFERYPKPEESKKTLLDVTTPKIPVPGLAISVGSVAVGLNLSLKGGLYSDAWVGPGRVTGAYVEVKAFDTAQLSVDVLRLGGGAHFEVPAYAGLTAGIDARLSLDAAVLAVGGSVGLTAEVGVSPKIAANVDFTLSRADGLDLTGDVGVSLKPVLSVGINGKLFAEATLLVSTITLWEKVFDGPKVSLDPGIELAGKIKAGYNSKTNKAHLDPPVFETPKIDTGALVGNVLGSGGTEKQTTKDDGKGGTQPVARKPAPGKDTAPGGQAAAPRSAKAQTDIAALGAGQPLDLAPRGMFEQRMGADFSQVRIHLGPAADESAQGVSARAFTVGLHIVFAEGAYDPKNEEGQRLLAHELAHVRQQQGGAAGQIMRETTTGSTEGGGESGSAGASAAPPTNAPAPATVAAPAVGGTPPLSAIDIPALRLPKFKADTPHRRTLYDEKVATQALRRPAKYERGETAQSATWMSNTQSAGALSKINALTGNESRPEPYLARPKRATRRDFVVGTPAELAESFKRPVWNRQEQWKYFHVDHIVELQVNGTDAIDNMELLEAGANMASGHEIRAHIEDDLEVWLKTHGSTPPETERSPRALKQNYPVNFATFQGAYGPGTADYWEKSEIDGGEQVDFAQYLNLYDPLAPKRGGGFAPWPSGVKPEDFSGSPTRVVLYPRESGGFPKAIDWPVDLEGDTRAVDDKNWIAGFHLQSVQFRAGGNDAEAGLLRGRLFDENPRLAFNGTPVEIPITRKSGLPHAGFIRKSSIQRQITAIFNQEGVAGLSPVSVTSFDIDPERGAVLRGQIRPSIGLIQNANIDLVIEGNDLRAEKISSASELALGGPFRILGSDLGVSLGTRSGLRVEGGADFAIQGLGQGRLGATASHTGEFAVGGEFNFDRSLFDADATVRLSYARAADAPSGKLAGEGDVTIGPNKIRGIRRANLHARFDGENREIRGNTELSIPGIESASLAASFTGADGASLAGTARFRDRPGIRNGQIDVRLRQAANAWQVAASSSAEANFAGISASLAASYDDGLFKFAGAVPFAVGPASGNVLVGVTNGSVDGEGNLAGSTDDNGSELRAFGNGTVNVRITEHLQGGVGLKVKPTGDILIGGRIGIPGAVTVFEQYPAPGQDRRTLFSLPTVSIPLLGAPGVGVSLNISGAVEGYAHIGPGQLTQAELNVVDFNPAQPDTLQVTGRAVFDLPGAAGVDARLDAGLAAGALISLEAGLGVTAGAGVEAHVRPSADIAWRPSTGLHLHADLNASLAPKLKFDVHGYARVLAGAFGANWELWRKDWQLAQKEIGSSLGLGLNAPVDYFSDGRGVVFDPAKVSFQVPALNADTFTQLLNDHGQSQTQTGEGRPPA